MKAGDKSACEDALAKFDTAYKEADALRESLIKRELPGAEKIKSVLTDANSDIVVLRDLLKEADALLEDHLEEIRTAKNEYIEVLKQDKDVTVLSGKKGNFEIACAKAQALKPHLDEKGHPRAGEIDETISAAKAEIKVLEEPMGLIDKALTNLRQAEKAFQVLLENGRKDGKEKDAFEDACRSIEVLEEKLDSLKLSAAERVNTVLKEAKERVDGYKIIAIVLIVSGVVMLSMSRS